MKKLLLVLFSLLMVSVGQAFPVKFKVNNSKSSKDYEQTSIGAQVNITEKTSVEGSFAQSKQGTYNKTTYSLGANHSYSETYTFYGDLSSSSDSSGIKGFGQSAGSDITISDYWEGELSTIATIEFGRSRYQGQETIENINYKTNYIESFWKVGLEQEIVSWMSINMARKKYTFKDSSTAILGRRTSSRHLTTLNIGPDYTNTVGVSFYKKEWPSITGNFSRTKNTDGTFDDEQNYSLLYKISNISLGGRFTHVKRSTGEVEDTWGPNIATSF